MKVIIVDDHPLLRIGIRNVLVSSDLNVEVIGEVASESALMKLLNIESADLVLLDIDLGDRNGLITLQELKKKYPNLPVLILSAYPEERFAFRAIKSGASGYLNKHCMLSELVKAVSTIHHHKKSYISEEVADILARKVIDGADKSPIQKLSDREYEVLLLIANGKTVSEIADTLSLSKQAIYTYRRRIRRKLNINSNAELMRYALEHELIV